LRWVSGKGRGNFAGEGESRRLLSLDGTIADITDRKRIDADLAFQRQQLELIFRDSPAAMALWVGDDLVFERVNPKYCDLFRGRALQDRPLLEAAPELAGQGFDEMLRRVMYTGEPFVGYEALARLRREKDGPIEDRYFDFTFLQVTGPDGGPWGVYDHAVDVTDRVLARRALEKSQAQLREALMERQSLLDAEQSARAEAERQGRMKDEFLATLSHELRTPLNAIVGWVQILRTAKDDPQSLDEGLSVIDRNARAQTQIIEDILDMSRIISGKLRLDIRRVELPTLIRAAVDAVQPAANARNVRLEAIVANDVPALSGDPNRLLQVLWNLINNAVKFTPAGGRVEVRLKRVDELVEIGVSDTGEGIDPAFLPYVFDRFRQADASTTRKHGGLGLGLSIVKQLVEMHGGIVRVSSAGKKMGATFTIELPLAAVPAEQVEQSSLPPAPDDEDSRDTRPNADQPLNGVDILCVDDEVDGQRVLNRLLQECGAIVRTAGSARDAMRLFLERKPAILISDIGMPEEDGYTFIRRIRALPPEAGGAVPAIALTAYVRPTDRIKAIEAGFQAHLAKPVDPPELIVNVAARAKRLRSMH
jgi:signal transduction histidine kinase/ActR/RegA family two-component response regulator